MIDHFVITRFNLNLRRGGRHLSEKWLKERLKLIKNTAISLGRQTDKNFKVLMFVHTETPEYVTKKIKFLYKKYKVKLEFLKVNTAKGSKLLLEEILSKYDKVITSRIDSDDRYAKYYIEKVKEACTKSKYLPLYVDFSDIIYKSNKRTNVYKYPVCSMFLSVYSKNPKINCFTYSHIKVHTRKLSIRTLKLIGGMIIVHGDNISNTMRGKKYKKSLLSIF